MTTVEGTDRFRPIRRRFEKLWTVYLAIVAALSLYITLPDKLSLGPSWVTPLVGTLLLIPLVVTVPEPSERDWPWRRVLSVALVAAINLANIVSLVLVVNSLLFRSSGQAGGQLIVEAMKIWAINVLLFALWYWEMDRGGPSRRLRAMTTGRGEPIEPDFLFPQMTMPEAKDVWLPSFVDYLYVSFTNATAFSPTDTLPLTPSAKMLMLVQALTSLISVAIVAARAVNILGSSGGQ